MSSEHDHCWACHSSDCDHPGNSCPVIFCRNQCGSKFHACKESEHFSLCPREQVACVNFQHGCPFKFERCRQGPHLWHCPASVVCCSHTWYRRNKAEAEDGRPSPDPLLTSASLDFTLAACDQERVGGAECLRECTVPARPVQRVCPGIGLEPRQEAPERLKSPIFARPDPKDHDSPQRSQSSSTGSCSSGTRGRQAIWPDPITKPSVVFCIVDDDPPSCLDIPDAGSACNDYEAAADSSYDADIGSQGDMSATSGVMTSSAEDSGGEDRDSRKHISGLCPLPEDSLSAPSNASGGVDTLHQNRVVVENKSNRHTSFSKGLTAALMRKRFKKRQMSSSLDSDDSKDAPPSPVIGVSQSSTSMSTRLRVHLRHGKHKLSKVVTGAMGANRMLGSSSVVIGGSSSSSAAPATRGGGTRSRHLTIDRTLWNNTDGSDTDSEVVVLSGSVSPSFSVTEHPSSSAPKLVANGDLIPSEHADCAASLGGSLHCTPPTSNISGASATTTSDGSANFSIIMERWRKSEALLCGTTLPEKREQLRQKRSSSFNSLVFELSLFFSPRQVCPADGLIQCQCMKFFRRDEIAQHQAFIHADLDSLLGAHLILERCPMASYGCQYVRPAMRPPCIDWSLCVTKRSIALRPARLVSPPQLASAADNDDKNENPSPVLHLTTLPVATLLHICDYLDPLSLTCLAEACTHLREVVSSLVQQRGMVVPVWERSEDEDGDVRWHFVKHRWTLSSFVTPVPVQSWLPTDEPPMKAHLTSCSLFTADRHQYGPQWRPLTGLTGVHSLEFTGDSDADTGSEEDEEVALEKKESVNLAVGLCRQRTSSFRRSSRRTQRGRKSSVSMDVNQLTVDLDCDCDVVSDEELPATMKVELMPKISDVSFSCA